MSNQQQEDHLRLLISALSAYFYSGTTSL